MVFGSARIASHWSGPCPHAVDERNDPPQAHRCRQRKGRGSSRGRLENRCIFTSASDDIRAPLPTDPIHIPRPCHRCRRLCLRAAGSRGAYSCEPAAVTPPARSEPDDECCTRTHTAQAEQAVAAAGAGGSAAGATAVRDRGIRRWRCLFRCWCWCRCNVGWPMYVGCEQQGHQQRRQRWQGQGQGARQGWH